MILIRMLYLYVNVTTALLIVTDRRFGAIRPAVFDDVVAVTIMETIIGSEKHSPDCSTLGGNGPS